MGGAKDNCVLSFRLILAVTLYCVIGAVVLRVKRGADGPELIPHRNFWLEMLALVKASIYACV